MLLKTICIFFIINAFSSYSDASPISFNILPELTKISNYLSNGYSQVKQYYIEGKKQVRNYICGLYKESEVESETESATESEMKSDTESTSDEANMIIRNCAVAESSGTYDIIIPLLGGQLYPVSCDAETYGGGWTVILRRLDGSESFNRNWTEYKEGFGDLTGEFFLGLDKIYALTAERPNELLVVLEDFTGDDRFELYDEFEIGNEEEQFQMHTLGKANGTAGNSLAYHLGMKFSTYDRDNDAWKSGNCATLGTGGWWYNLCQHSNLAGKYNETLSGRGIYWRHFRGYKFILKKAIMMIRPKSEK